jgi:hypothetical protein
MGCSDNKNVETTDQPQPTQTNELIKSTEINQKTINNTNLSMSYNTLKNSNSKENYCLQSKEMKMTKKGKDPYVISQKKTDTCNIVIIKINPTYFLREYLIPIWFEKNTFIKFTTKGKWRIDKNYEYTDSTGMPSSRSLIFNYGALVARVGKNPAFLLPPNEYTYHSKKAGPLYLRMNLPKKLKVNPEGSMEIRIFDVEMITMEEINKKIGWKQQEMKFDVDESTEFEQNLANDINDLRMNPVLFYERNVKHIQNSIWTESFLKDMKYNNDYNGIQPLSINNDCYVDIHNYIAESIKNIEKKIGNKKNQAFTEEMQNLISINLKPKYSDNVVNCKLTKKYNSIDVCIQYLLDEKFRKNIFNKDFKSIAVKIFDDFFVEGYLIIIVFLKVEEKPLEEEEEEDKEEEGKGDKDKENEICNIK